MTPLSPVTPHLTEDQFGELLSASTKTALHTVTPVEAHLLDCEQCAAEMTSVRNSLSLFREASTAYADDQLRNLPPLQTPARPARTLALWPAYWATAAAMLLAALLPIQTLRPHPTSPAPTATATVAERPAQSDEALLDDIDRELSASVPTPMQALADPTAGTEASVQNSTQRKN
jgi:hypothetical protein